MNFKILVSMILVLSFSSSSCTKSKGGSSNTPTPVTVVSDLLPSVSNSDNDKCNKDLSNGAFSDAGYSNECLVSKGGSLTKVEVQKLISSRVIHFDYSSDKDKRWGLSKSASLNFKDDGSYDLRFFSTSKLVVSNTAETPVIYAEENRGRYKVLDSGDIELFFPIVSSCMTKIRSEGSVILSTHLFRKKGEVIVVAFPVDAEVAPLFGQRGTIIFGVAPYGKTDLPAMSTDYTRGNAITLNGVDYATMYGCFIDKMTTFQEEVKK